MHLIVTILATLGSIVLPLRGADADEPAAPTLEYRTELVGAYCVEGPAYYAFELVTTRNIPGTGLAKGQVDVRVAGSSPFSVALGPDGSYEYDLGVSLDRMKVPRQGRLIAWVTTPEIDHIERMGALDENLRGAGHVTWNKFIVVVTLETEDDPSQTTWNGPIVFRGMSRSGMMHTMVGHGALQQENCAAFGYGN